MVAGVMAGAVYYKLASGSNLLGANSAELPAACLFIGLLVAAFGGGALSADQRLFAGSSAKKKA